MKIKGYWFLYAPIIIFLLYLIYPSIVQLINLIDLATGIMLLVGIYAGLSYLMMLEYIEVEGDFDKWNILTKILFFISLFGIIVTSIIIFGNIIIFIRDFLISIHNWLEQHLTITLKSKNNER